MSDSDVRDRPQAAAPTGQYAYSIKNPKTGWVHNGRSDINPAELAQRGFSDFEQMLILTQSNDPGPTPVRGDNGDYSKSNFIERSEDHGRSMSAYQYGQELLRDGPGSKGNIEWQGKGSWWDKHGSDVVFAATLAGGGAVIGGGLAAAGAEGAGGAGAGAGAEGTTAGTTYGASGLSGEGVLASESGFVPGSFELGAGEGLGATDALTATGGLSEGNNMDFFDEILNDPVLEPETTGGTDYGSSGLSEEGPLASESGFVPGSFELGEGAGLDASNPEFLDLVRRYGLQAARMLFGGGAGGAGGARNPAGGGSNFNPWALGAGLAALNYARNQDPFDTSRLESAYSSIDPNSLAFPYDIQTGKGRESLNSSLTNRGVMGSSFANQDISSYDTMRGLGRQNLLTSGATAQANIGKQILDSQVAQQKNKNDLYGRALLALSGVGAPPSPFANLF
jgi:hypothetical protein